MLNHGLCIGGEKRGQDGQEMTAKLLSYWANTDCNPTLADMDPHVIHSLSEL